MIPWWLWAWFAGTVLFAGVFTYYRLRRERREQRPVWWWISCVTVAVFWPCALLGVLIHHYAEQWAGHR